MKAVQASSALVRVANNDREPEAAVLAQQRGLNRGGRPKGVRNKATREFRETVQRLLEDNADNVALWLRQVAEGVPAVLRADGTVLHAARPPSPEVALLRLAALAEFAAPRLSRAEVTGEAGGPLTIVVQRLG
jgi:hypothetical protein